MYKKNLFFTLIISVITTCIIYADKLPEKPIAIIVPSRNNNALFEGKLRYQLNLDSIFSQDYDNYRVIYVDDNSTDGTADLVQQYFADNNQSQRLTLLRNTQRYGPSRNRFVGVQLADDNEIVMFLDGDDFFSNSQVLNRINSEYANPNIWVTYSQFQTVPNNTFSGGEPVPQWVIDENKHREYGWYYHSLKTFYAWLGKLVKLEDLLYDGKFYPISSDIAEMFPIVEMSGGRFSFVPDIMYYATQYANNEMHVYGKELMSKMSAHIFTLPPYQPIDLSTRPVDTSYAQVDIILYAKNGMHQLKKSLRSIEQFGKSVNSVIVLMPAIYRSETATVVGIMPNISLVYLDDQMPIKKQLALQLIKVGSYVLFAPEDFILTEQVDFNRAVSFLELTNAHAFYLGFNYANFNATSVPLLHIVNQLNEPERILAWQFKAGNNVITDYESAAALYRKDDLMSVFAGAQFSTIPELFQVITQNKVDGKKLGLFFERSKIEISY